MPNREKKSVLDSPEMCESWLTWLLKNTLIIKIKIKTERQSQKNKNFVKWHGLKSKTDLNWNPNKNRLFRLQIPIPQDHNEKAPQSISDDYFYATLPPDHPACAAPYVEGPTPPPFSESNLLHFN